ncbi:MAG: TM2 domain-containing protein, partial [Isoptericola variabilis]|nr:TM2 domain-containing protein [Isoptericola variabilis]
MSAPQQPGYNAPVQGKSRMVAGLLNLFLGGFGVGDFYLGYTQYGIY